MHTKFHEDWLRHSKVDTADTQAHRLHGDLICLLLFFVIVITKGHHRTVYEDSIFHIVYKIGSRDRSVDIVTGYGLDGQGSIPGKGERHCSPALDGGEWPASRPGRFTPEKEPPVPT
jgi:hypothetical protein